MAEDVTQLLLQWGRGDQRALDELMPLVYQEIRKRAQSLLRLERAGHSLNGTALVHEVYVRLVDQQQMTWQNRAQFFGLACQVMRNILVDHARSRNRLKRGGGAVQLQLSEGMEELPARQQDLDLVKLDDALNQLARLDPQQSRIIELRYFTGLTIEETAEVMQLSTATVKRHWLAARLWLLREMAN